LSTTWVDLNIGIKDLQLDKELEMASIHYQLLPLLHRGKFEAVGMLMVSQAVQTYKQGNMLALPLVAVVGGGNTTLVPCVLLSLIVIPSFNL